MKDNSYIAPLLDAKSTYYWRVDATNAAGVITQGDAWTFTTQGGLGLKVDKASYAPGEKIVVSFDGAESTTDWIGIFGQGAPKATSWKYLNDSTQAPAQIVGKGQVTIDAPAKSGSYSIRALLKDVYKDVDEIVLTVR